MTNSNTFRKNIKEIFFTPVATSQHWGLILLIAGLFIFLRQFPPIDWDLNTKGLWDDGLNMYVDPNRVYPPWALILLLPYYLMRAEGARFLSVMVIGWLAHRRGWTISTFLASVLGPYFLVTLSKSNVDILVLVFPMLLWESVEGTRWQSLGRGLALSILLLKPQGAVLLWLYLLWNSRKDWQNLVKPLLIVAALVVPISLIGSPPLILQWWNNINNPSPQNELWWSVNNISLSSYLSPFSAVIVLIASFAIVVVAIKWRGNRWSNGHTVASLLLVSMLLSPYTSQQSFSSALVFIPSWWSVFIQILLWIIAFLFFNFLDYIPIWALLSGLAALYFYRPNPVTLLQEDQSESNS